MGAVKEILSVAALWDKIFDFDSEISSLCFLKNDLVSTINKSRAPLDLPRMTRSSANKIAEMLISWRSIPSPEEFNLAPRPEMYKEKSSGLKLHPKI